MEVDDVASDGGVANDASPSSRASTDPPFWISPPQLRHDERELYKPIEIEIDDEEPLEIVHDHRRSDIFCGRSDACLGIFYRATEELVNTSNEVVNVVLDYASFGERTFGAASRRVANETCGTAYLHTVRTID